MARFFDEFKKFILRGNVIDLAVGIVIGAAFSKIVDSLVADIFMPIVGFLTGGFNISGYAYTVRDVTIRPGNFLQATINFIIIGFCLFLVVKGMNALHHRLLKEEAAKPPEPSPTEKLLAEIRDLLRARDSNANGLPANP
jgi:large conductance mechanosensitive channel